MNKLLVVFNTCGISRENPSQYIKGIQSLLDQDLEGCRIVLSSCLNSRFVRQKIKEAFGDKISYNFIEESLPVNVTFNHSCLRAIKEFGEFEGYLYVDSGITMRKSTDLSNLYNLMKSGPYGMVAAQTSTDAGYLQWFGIGSHHHDTSQNHLLFKDGDFVIPVGKTVNLHAQIFSNELYKQYGYFIPDIYAGYCTESVFSFICAAANQKFVLSKDVMVDHIHGMDGGSSGFDPLQWVRSGRPTSDHPFLVDSVVRIARDGQKFGFGYEECQSIVVHDPTKFDSNGFAVDSDLRVFIRNNQYLGNIGLLNYSKIDHEWIK